MKTRFRFKAVLFIFSLLLPLSFVFGATNNNSGGKVGSQLNNLSRPNAEQNLKNFGLLAYGTGAQSDPQIIVAKIINAGLGLLGTLLVIYMVYGGVYWMTANGETQKVDKAKAIIRQAIIGLIITLSAYGISAFVTRVVLDGVTK